MDEKIRQSILNSMPALSNRMLTTSGKNCTGGLTPDYEYCRAVLDETGVRDKGTGDMFTPLFKLTEQADPVQYFSGVLNRSQKDENTFRYEGNDGRIYETTFPCVTAYTAGYFVGKNDEGITAPAGDGAACFSGQNTSTLNAFRAGINDAQAHTANQDDTVSLDEPHHGLPPRANGEAARVVQSR